jgi:predicted TPR repeat methyltransferase
MSQRDTENEKARAFFEEIWQRPDHWEFDTSSFERARLEHLIDMLGTERYSKALELGCGSGVFTSHLADIADRVLAVDISETALDRARERGLDARVQFRAENIMELDVHRDGPWDLIVLSETVYYLGWLYPFFDIAWLASQLYSATREGGSLLLSNTEAGVEDELLRPWIIRTYRDLFCNVGFKVEREATFEGEKNGVQIGVLTTLLRKPSGETHGE